MSQIFSEIKFDCKIKSRRSINIFFFSIRTRLELICIIYILCSVLFTFHFSPMSQIFSEIKFDCKIKSRRSINIFFFSIRTRLELICIIYILCSVLFTFHFSLMLQIFSEIKSDCKIKSRRSINIYLFICYDTDSVIEPICITSIIYSVLFIFYFSLMSQIFSEIVYNCKNN